MIPSLFSQSLFAVPLEEAIRIAAQSGYTAIEIACTRPHFLGEGTRAETEAAAAQVAGLARSHGLRVAALSLFNEFTNPETFDGQVEKALGFLRLCPVFGTSLAKLNPGGPESAKAETRHWDSLARALELLVLEAERLHLRLAFETHMRQLTDTLDGSLRLLRTAGADCVGLTVDYSNLAFAGESVADAARTLLPHTYHTHVKNGFLDKDGGWRFGPLDRGLTDYRQVLPILADAGYRGYLSVECLGPDAKERPGETVSRDLSILRELLGGIG